MAFKLKVKSHHVFAFAGYSGAGKTTLIEQVIALLHRRGLRVALIKHAHHDFDIDVPGKDSYRHRKAGAAEVLVAGGQRWALMHELRGAPEPTLYGLLAHVSAADLVLVEGFKKAPVPKLEVWRAATGKPLLFPADPDIIAFASDDAPPQPLEPRLRRFGLDEVAAVADFALQNAARVTDVGALQQMR